WSASDCNGAAVVRGGDGEGHVAGAGAARSADTDVGRAGDDWGFAVADRHGKAAGRAVAMAITGAAIHGSRSQGKAAAAGRRAGDGGGAAVVSGGDREHHIAGTRAARGVDTDIGGAGD